MKRLFLSVSAFALMAPVVFAPPAGAATPAEPPATEVMEVSEESVFLVFFDWNKATLTPEGKQVVAEAAETYKETGQARVVVTGHTDTSGSAAYNLGLSERRAETVANELIALGVPATSMVTVGKGQEDPLVSTGDGVREAQNRRVEIEIPTPPVEVVAPPPPPPPPPPAPKKWSVGLGGYYGYSIEEQPNKRDQSDDKSAHLGGIQGNVEYAITKHVGIGVDAAAYNTFDTSANDGWGYRSTIKLPFYFTAGSFRPFIGPHAGYIGGKGVQDSILAGPTGGFTVDVADNTFFYGQIAYDVLVERNDVDKGVISTGAGIGFRF